MKYSLALLSEKHLNRHQELNLTFLINITNDSWYGDSSEPHQHLFLSRWRSIEFGIPVVSAQLTQGSLQLFHRGVK